MRTIRILSMLLVVIVLVACAPVPQMELSFDPSVLRFSGENAYELEEEFVTTFTRRVSGTEQSRLGTEWLRQQLEGYGWNCGFDDWEVINYSKPVQLRNVWTQWMNGKYWSWRIMTSRRPQSREPITTVPGWRSCCTWRRFSGLKNLQDTRWSLLWTTPRNTA